MDNLPEEYLVLGRCGQGEYEEKKSRFLSCFAVVESPEEAMAFVEQVRKKHYDARHNCYAYILGKRGEQLRSSDDGEPSGTAGRPMLDALQGAGLTNVVAVVTRYFGGTLLGTGGLTRAYAQAMKEGLADSTIRTMRLGIACDVSCSYDQVGRLQRLFAAKNCQIKGTDYTDRVLFHLLVPSDVLENLEKEVVEATAGTGHAERGEAAYYIDKERAI